MNDDIIERVENELIIWISLIVCVLKKNFDEIRVCVDMKEVNKVIVRVRYLMFIVDEFIYDLNGLFVFSKLDLR